jgi:hypothetical protein
MRSNETRKRSRNQKEKIFMHTWKNEIKMKRCINGPSVTGD